MSATISRTGRKHPSRFQNGSVSRSNHFGSISQMLRNGLYERQKVDAERHSHGLLNSDPLIDSRFDDAGLPESVVIVDCSEVSMISSDDLNALIGFHTGLRNESCRVVLRNVQQPLVDIFEMTRLNRLFLIEEAASEMSPGSTA